MNNCILKKRIFESTQKAEPLLSNSKANMFAIRMIDLLNEMEVEKLQEYTELLFAQIDDKRRKKFARVRNYEAAKSICKRLKLKKIKIDEEQFAFDDYCEDIEIIVWLQNKFLSGTNHRTLTKNKYVQDSDLVFLTIVISLDPKTVHTVITDEQDEELASVNIFERTSLLFCEKLYKLRETMFNANRTQIYFHMRYKRV